MRKILIADDETRIRILLRDFLESEGYEVIEASNGLEAYDLVSNDTSIDLVILDIMMPEMDGYETLESIREFTKVPVLMLTAKVSEKDEIKGFKLGVDDYIRKPFRPLILMARVNALIQRVYGTENIVRKGFLTIDYESKEVYNTPSEDVTLDVASRIDLSSKEYQLLTILIEYENHILSRDQLLTKVWGYDYDGTERTVDTHMNRLRQKLSTLSGYVQTVRGFGYKFEVKED